MVKLPTFSEIWLPLSKSGHAFVAIDEVAQTAVFDIWRYGFSEDCYTTISYADFHFQATFDFVILNVA